MELFLGRKLLTPFERLTFTKHKLYEREKADFDIPLTEAQEALEKAHVKQAKYYNYRR